MPTGRFAPSPTGPLHIGNLRTALLAWLFARSSGSAFLVRIEDLDPVTSRREHADAQLRDLEALGLDWDGPVVYQSERRERHEWAIDQLTRAGRTYECYCSRREIELAASAPHGDGLERPYPGTCRWLDASEREARRREGRRPAIRLTVPEGEQQGFTDAVHGPVSGLVDDLVLRRNDGTPAYNLAVVVDDADQGVGQVVRGDDLLATTPRQLHVGASLALAAPSYAHVPLVVGVDGERLAKRHGAVTLGQLAAIGITVEQVRTRLAAGLGLAEAGEPVTPADLVERFDPGRVGRERWTFDPALDRQEV